MPLQAGLFRERLIQISQHLGSPQWLPDTCRRLPAGNLDRQHGHVAIPAQLLFTAAVQAYSKGLWEVISKGL